MVISELILYRCAKLLLPGNVSQTQEMKEALASEAAHGTYRRGLLDAVLEAAGRYDVPIAGRDLCDLGCSDGSISPGYLEVGARSVVGVDIDEGALERARAEQTDPRLSFALSTPTGIPIPDASIDTIVCYDVFEHVSTPDVVLAECRRILRPGGKLLIGTWGWRHPFAPHLWSTMPVPWAHLLVSERTLLRACRRVYQSSWYVPNMHDFDEHGVKKPEKYTGDHISTDYLNKYLVADFERAFARSGMDFVTHPQPFGSRYAAWTRGLIRVPWIREFVTGYFWAVLTKREDSA